MFELVCVLEDGEGVVVLQRLAQRVDNLGGVDFTAIRAHAIRANATQCVVGEAAKKTVHAKGVLLAVNGEMGASLIAYLRLVRVVLSFSASHIALMPSAV